MGDRDGLTALHHHLRNGSAAISLKVVDKLLTASANVNHRDRTLHTRTPLLLAVKSQRADVVDAMLTNALPPADVDAKGADGVSVLEAASGRGRSPAIAKMLRERGASRWADVEVFLGGKTKVAWDTRDPEPPRVPLLGVTLEKEKPPLKRAQTTVNPKATRATVAHVELKGASNDRKEKAKALPRSRTTTTA